MSYVKLFGSILDSTIWKASPPTKVVWVTMMAMADRDGVVSSSVPGLVDRARVTRPEAEDALSLFLSPDPDSRTEQFDGRRIEKVDGGWRLLNYEKYREMQSADDRREKAADRVRRHREREKQRTGGAVTPAVTLCNVGNAGNPIRSGSGSGTEQVRAEAPTPIATRLRPGPVTGQELKRLFAAIREQQVPGTLAWQTPAVRDGKETSMAEMIEATPSARADVAPSMELLFRKAKDGKCGKNSKLVLEKPAFGFACWISDWTSLREEIHGKVPGTQPKTRMELAQEAEAAAWRDR